MRAMSWGMTSSHVSMLTEVNPSLTTWLTSLFPPWANHKVSNRNVSCRELVFDKAMDLKNPLVAGTTWSRMTCSGRVMTRSWSAWEVMELTTSKLANAQACQALYH